MTATRRIGDSDVYPIGLGCMNLSHAYGAPTEPAAASRLLNEALDLGCNFFDTATIYGAGENEKLVAASVGERRKDIFLASKCVLDVRDGKRVLDGRPGAIKAACDASLKRLNTDVIDLYYMHRPDPNVPIEDSVGALSELVEAGKIRFVGLSEMGQRLIERAHAVHPITAVQSEYSLWVRNPEIAVMETCRDLDIALVAFSPVGRGFLADPPFDPANMHEKDMRRFFPRFSDENYPGNLDLLDEARACAAEVGCTVAQLALAWLLAKGDHVLPIPGTTSSDHLKDNVAAADVTLDDDMVARLDAHFTPESAVGPRYNEQIQATVDTEQFEFETRSSQ
ncbi:aldo/keto reductase [Henriciella litoralis]|uniref:aldo/keto reductase n=1 Tax=Henriciella litoralis TaxID=568102 RepID=UPI000A0712DC|nr:aldo/keto reductase [Henriciella litoralis]